MNMTTIDEKKKPLARVREIQTRKLFGLYNHDVKLFLDDRVTILHGPNGVGKTILLKLIHAVFSQDIPFLLSVPCEQLTITIDDGTKIDIRQHKANEEAAQNKSSPLTGTLHFTITRHGDMIPDRFDVDASSLNFEEWAIQYQKSIPWLHPVGPGQWHDQRTNHVHSAYDLWLLAVRETSDRPSLATIAKLPASYLEVTKLVSTYFVETQRLIRYTSARRNQPWLPFGSVGPTPTVIYDAQELSAQLRDAFAQYGRVSQSLDQTFPQRLFSEEIKSISTSEIKERIQQQEEQRHGLQEYGVLDEQPKHPFNLDLLDKRAQDELKAMTLYVQDTNKKLEVLIKFLNRVKPLIASINQKFKNKRIQINREVGLSASSSSGQNISLDQLSSGEQHEIVILYDLLYRVLPNTLVMIDEPELSLHIDWQRRFLPELLTIVKEVGYDVLIATHSPSIIGERDDLMRELKTD